MNFHMPVKVFTGEKTIEQHKEEVAALGKSCLILTGAAAAKSCGALDDMTAVLDDLGTAWALYDKVGANPALSSCMEAGRLAAERGADFVIGIGGGSAMDAAKAAAVLAANPALDEAGFYGKDWKNPPLPILLVGTTSGTGSEVTDVSVLTDSKMRKHSIHDPRMYARLAFGDGRYTVTMPRAVTLSTGIDVLAHCTESYFSKKSNEISRAFALRGISLLFPALSAAAEGAELSLQQRNELYEASILGGLAICVTGTAFPHNVGYYLTENYHIPHGTACAAFLPELLDHADKACPEYAEAFYRTLGRSRAEVKALIAAAMPALDVHMTAEEIAAALPRWENNGSVKNTVGHVTTAEIKTILENKFLK